MEMRFIRIITCSDCPFSGHETDSKKDTIVHFCTHAENMNIEQLHAVQIDGKIYPITSVTERQCSIPFWCKLPKETI